MKHLKVILMGARSKKFRFGFGAITAITATAFSLGVLAGKKEKSIPKQKNKR
jgi:hypothetical protein